MRILVAGMVAGDPRQGGATVAVLQYVRGLERLGHDVLLVEPVAELRPDVVSYFGTLALPRAALLRAGTRETAGLAYDQLAGFEPDVVLNVSGMLRDPELLGPAAVRVYLDLDPVFNQLWHADGIDVGLAGHTSFVTVGVRLAETALPLDRRWTTTLPPVVLDDWPLAGEVEHDAFTTVGNWRGYGSVTWEGAFYGQRAHATRRLLELPRASGERFAVALAIHPGEERDLSALREHGWELVDPVGVAGDPDAYRRFVSGSFAEIGIPKAGYADARCGWFSDRSACYLASGRPVVALDTGFGAALPTGEGLLAFESVEDGAAAVRAVRSDDERHRRAARAIAEEHLDSDRVLTRLLEVVA